MRSTTSSLTPPATSLAGCDLGSRSASDRRGVRVSGAGRTVGVGEFEVAVRKQLDDQVVTVDPMMVTTAKQPEVVDLGWSEVVPVLDVMTIAP